ncbi:MAG: hypothetical protein QXQ48_06715 [Nitrososphaerota archaeon]
MLDCNTGGALKDGTAVVLHGDIDVAVRSLARPSEKDARTYRALYEKFSRMRGSAIASLSYNPPTQLDDLRKTIKGDLGEEFIMFSTMTMYNAVAENFEDKRVRTFLKLVIHSFQSGNDPMTGGALTRLKALINTLSR